MQTVTEFPKGFMWGAATSAYQCEGAAAEDGKKENQQDVINRQIHDEYGYADASVTTDHYHHYKEDVALMAEMGFTSYRFSINWSRVLPEGVGEPNAKGVQFYHDLIHELKAHNIEPIVTMWHYDLPMALVNKYGGWRNKQIVKDFEYYARFLCREYGKEVKYWLTINEQSIVVNYIDKKNLISIEDYFNPKFRYQANHYMNLAHARAAKAVHELVADGKAGAALDMAPYYPATPKPEDVKAAKDAANFKNYFYMNIYFKGIYTPSVMQYLQRQGLDFQVDEGDMDIIKEGAENFDFLGINYYQSACVKAPSPNTARRSKQNNKIGKGGKVIYEVQPDLFEGTKNEYLLDTDFSMPIDPVGLQYVLEDINDRYHKPLMICENGFGAYDVLEKDGRVHDLYRIEYIRAHIKAMKNAVANGVELLGYNPWSAFDLLSTSNGIAKRYGFIYVDRTDDDVKECKRYKKDSFYWYKNVIATNGKNLE
ncbi:MAG: glycoside hydrolase family 1 protein [Bulleidia sp.]